MHYKFTLRGRLESTVEKLLDPLSVSVEGDVTDLVVEASDDAELFGVMAKIERLGLSIVSFEPVGGTDVDKPQRGPMKS